MVGAILAKRDAVKAFKAISRHDVDTVVGMFHDDCAFEFPSDTVLGGRYEGKEKIRAWFERWFARMPETNSTLRHITVENIFALGATNVVHIEWDLDETDQEGHSYHLTGVTALEVEGGKARKVKDYIFDQGLIAAIWPSKETATT